jgi:GTP cyclohydrolase I
MTVNHDFNEHELDAKLALRKRRISEEQMRKFEGYAAEIFSAFGMNLNEPATVETPHRFIRALYDATDGYDGDPKLIKVFETECSPRANPVFRALRASRFAVLRSGVRGIHSA